MGKDKIKKIEAKVKLGLPITKEERALYIIHAKVFDMEVLNATVKA